MSTDRRTVETYSDVAEHYRSHVSNPAESPLHAYYEKPALHDALPELDGLTVLNLGCGDGSDVDWASQAGARQVVGIDIAAGLMRVAHQNFPEDLFAVMDMADLGFRDESFDVAFSSLAIHYLPDWQQPLGEVYRVLKPGSLFVFSCNHPLETSLVSAQDDERRTATYGRTILQISEEREIIGDYLSNDGEGIRKIQGTVADTHTVTYYHRTFGSMVKSIVASGFEILDFIEPVPLPEMAVDNPEHYKQVLKQPKFGVWVVQKPLSLHT